jgi:hypothetical protein
MKSKKKSYLESALLSCDYYLHHCNYRSPKNYIDFVASITEVSSVGSGLSVYLDGVSAAAFFDEISKISVAPGTAIYIHKSDVIPSEDQFRKMFDFGLKLYSINWLGDREFCTPIPIGIPPGSSSSFHGNYIREKLATSQSDSVVKKYEYHVNFDITTNIIHRKAALQTFMNLPGTFIPSRRLDTIEYLNAILNSRYIICPPGAGADTYRVWEAIYLGSIPVVLEDFWAFGHLDLPVVKVKTFADFLKLVQTDVEMPNPIVTKDFIIDLPNKFR